MYIYENVKENAIELYGFITQNEQNLFLNLIGVKGLGPKGALAILASSTFDEINSALNEDDVKFFSSFPGIGQKLSQQIILDLKGKISLKENDQNVSKQLTENIILALKALGYTTNEIKTVLKKIKLSQNTKLKDAVKLALIYLKQN